MNSLPAGGRQLKIVLFQPEIPHNAGAAIRLCAGMRAQLHLIRPLGFSLSDKHLARVALGYHDVMRPILHRNLAAFLGSLEQEEQLLLFSSKATVPLHRIEARARVALLFGSETQGLKAIQSDGALQLRLEHRALAVKIPQAGHFRCHNLSNSIAMGTYEILRQWNFPALS